MADVYKDALRDFWDFVASYRTFPAWMAKAAAAGPVVNIVTRLGPPWPVIGGVSLCTAVVEVVVLIAVFQHAATHRVAKKRLESALRWSGVGIVFLFLLYLGLFKFLTFYDPDAGKWSAKGLKVRPALAQALNAPAPKPEETSGPDLRDINASTSEQEFLKLVGYDARLYWQGWSVDLVEYALLVNWLAFFVILACYVSLFVVLQRNEKAARDAKEEKDKARART